MGGYVGRFAPTPSGPLHLGSLFTAVASFLDARARQGAWRLRIDDLDAPRSVPGATDDILRALDAHGLHWDGRVACQSDHVERYRAALDALREQALCFRCTCSRKDLRGHRVYPGTCRRREPPATAEAAIRVRAPHTEYAFLDRLQGRCGEHLADAAGDFLVARRDGYAAYALAVVVDDAAMGVTDVVRGADLLDATPRQLFLLDRLGTTPPRYLHLPVIADRSGAKLSKRTAVTAVRPGTFPARNILWALNLLGMDPPHLPAPAELLTWATSRWDDAVLPRGRILRTWTSL